MDFVEVNASAEGVEVMLWINCGKQLILKTYGGHKLYMAENKIILTEQLMEKMELSN